MMLRKRRRVDNEITQGIFGGNIFANQGRLDTGAVYSKMGRS